MSESGERARAAALGRQRAQAEQREAQAILDRIPPPWYRVAAARAHRRAADEARVTFERARYEIGEHENALAHLGAGADPDEWGVFSLAPGVSLEATLARLEAGRYENADLAGAAAALRPLVAPARASTVLGDAAARKEIERAVAALAARAPRRLVRDLIDHLPARERPLPARAEDLAHYGRYKLLVTESASKIRLDDIVMGSVRGRGFGSSLLQELCRYADHRSLPIVCTMMTDYPDLPRDASPEEYKAAQRTAERRLAGWYHRHGFRSSRPVDEWKSRTDLRREPGPHERKETT